MTLSPSTTLLKSRACILRDSAGTGAANLRGGSTSLRSARAASPPGRLRSASLRKQARCQVGRSRPLYPGKQVATFTTSEGHDLPRPRKVTTSRDRARSRPPGPGDVPGFRGRSHPRQVSARHPTETNAWGKRLGCTEAMRRSRRVVRPQPARAYLYEAQRATADTTPLPQEQPATPHPIPSPPSRGSEHDLRGSGGRRGGHTPAPPKTHRNPAPRKRKRDEEIKN